MYNILDFINSKDVREFNKNRTFSPAEQVGIICDSFCDLDSKMKALIEIAEIYTKDEDYQLSTVGIKSIYDFSGKSVNMSDTILNTVKAWQRVLSGAKCYNVSNIVYFAQSFNVGETHDNEIPLPSFDAALDYINRNQTCNRAYIKKVYLDYYGIKDTEYFCYINNDLIAIDLGEKYLQENKDIGLDITSLRYVLPTPFKAGDIIKSYDFYDSYVMVCSKDDIIHRSEDMYYNNNYMDYMSYDSDRYIQIAAFTRSNGFDSFCNANINTMEYADLSELENDQKVLLMISDVYLGNLDFVEMLWHDGYDNTTLDGLIRYAQQYIYIGKL